MRWYFPNKENLLFQSQMDESKPFEEIRNWKHPLWYGRDQFKERIILTFLENQKGSLTQPHDSFPDAGEAINDFWSMSGSFIYRHHVEPRVKLYSPREESVPYSTKTLTYPELLKRIWTPSKRSALMIIGTLMDLETCLILGQVSHNFPYWKKKLQTDICGPWRDWRENSLHPGQIIYGQNSGNQWEGTPSWRRSKVVWGKAPSWKHTKIARDLFHRQPKIWNSKKPQNARKKLETSVAPALPCKIMNKNCGSGTSNKIKTKPQKCVWEIRYSIIMKTFLQEKVKIHYSTTI